MGLQRQGARKSHRLDRGGRNGAPAGGEDVLLKEPPGWLSGGLIGATIAAVAWGELRRPLREAKDPKARRDVRNLFVAAMSALAIRITEKPLTSRLSKWVRRRRFGLLQWIRLPRWMEVGLSVALLDYTLYVWHVLTHRIPFLWRFHRVHHADRDLDASTALRFHFLEMVLSVPWRCLQVLAIGAAPYSLALWQSTTLAAILFHHSNVRLPKRLEGRLSRLFMTPRLHGIHHSVVPEEVNSNWSTIFSWPDALHGTRRTDVAQEDIDIGVPEVHERSELTLGKLVRMPFGRRKPMLRYPDGTRPQRRGRRIVSVRNGNGGKRGPAGRGR